MAGEQRFDLNLELEAEAKGGLVEVVSALVGRW